MPTNEYRFLCVNTESLWEEGQRDNLDIGEDGISLKSARTPTFEREWRGLDHAVDFDIDLCGVLFILDEGGRIRTLDTRSGRIEIVPCITLAEPRAIAIGTSHVYVAYDSHIRALTKVDLQTRWDVALKETPDPDAVQELSVQDMVVDGEQHLYVLAGSQVLRFDKGGAQAKIVSIDKEAHGEVRNIAIYPRPDSERTGHRLSLLVLTSKKRLLEYDLDAKKPQESEQQYTLHSLADADPRGLAVRCEQLYVGDARAEGEDRFLFAFDLSQSGHSWSGLPGPNVGQCTALTVFRKGDLFVLGQADGRITHLQARKTLVPNESGTYSGTYSSTLLDSHEPGCHWHRFELELAGELPANTEVAVRYRISEIADAEPTWSERVINPTSALILSPKGRYIQFELTLSSADGVDTPRIKSIMVYCPRRSYLRYLPAVYQEDKTSRDFLERFLSLFETILWELEQRIDDVPRYFDSDGTPDQFVRWLVSWFGMSADEHWTPPKLRRLLKEAPELFKKRGTRDGLAQVMKLFLAEPAFASVLRRRIEEAQGKGASHESLEVYGDWCEMLGAPLIIEGFQLDCLEAGERTHARAQIRESWMRLLGPSPYHFCVLLRPYACDQPNDLEAVRRIVAQDKPAHTVGGVVPLQPWYYLGIHTYLEVNTILNRQQYVLGITSVLSRDTVLGSAEASGQLGLRARIGIDANLT